jgi:magnesium and cobalt transporter
MSDAPAPQVQSSEATTSATSKARTFIERIATLFGRAPENRPQLLESLRDSRDRGLLDSDGLSMIEGVLQVSELSARDIMMPRSQMDVINIRQRPDEFIPFVIATGNSRFPVVDDERDNVIGILHSKDLLKFYAHEEFDVRAMLRPAVFIPESKRLNVLLRDFKLNRNHIAIVVDEYGGVAGMITIEDVLEQIVGDIEDEFDFDEIEDHIVETEHTLVGKRYRVKAITDILQFNEHFKTGFSDDEFDTIGGLITDQFGRVPRRGEAVVLGELRFEVLRADERQVQLLLVETHHARKALDDKDD